MATLGLYMFDNNHGVVVHRVVHTVKGDYAFYTKVEEVQRGCNNMHKAIIKKSKYDSYFDVAKMGRVYFNRVR